MKQNRRNIIIAVIAIPLLVMLGVFAGVYFANKNSGSEEPVKEEVINEATIPLDEFVLNVESQKNRKKFIRLDVSLSTIDEGDTELIEKNMDKIRDIIIHSVSRSNAEELINDKEGTENLKKIIRDGINETFSDDVVHQVYITNIVMQ